MIHECRYKKTRIKGKGNRGGIHQPFYGTWVADFTLRQDAEKFVLGKYLSDIQIPWSLRRSRHLRMVVAGFMTTAS